MRISTGGRRRSRCRPITYAGDSSARRGGVVVQASEGAPWERPSGSILERNGEAHLAVVHNSMTSRNSMQRSPRQTDNGNSSRRQGSTVDSLLRAFVIIFSFPTPRLRRGGSSRRSDSLETVEIVRSRIGAWLGKRCWRQITTLEDVEQQEDGIGETDAAVVVRVAGVATRRR